MILSVLDSLRPDVKPWIFQVKPISNKKSYYCRKLEREEAERLRMEEREANKDKLSGKSIPLNYTYGHIEG